MLGREESGIHELYMMLNSIETNLDQLADNCCDVYGKNERIVLPKTGIFKIELHVFKHTII